MQAQKKKQITEIITGHTKLTMTNITAMHDRQEQDNVMNTGVGMRTYTQNNILNLV